MGNEECSLSVQITNKFDLIFQLHLVYGFSDQPGGICDEIIQQLRYIGCKEFGLMLVCLCRRRRRCRCPGIDGGAARALFYNRSGGVAKVPTDMKGIKLRTTGSEIEMALFDQWGASSVPMNFNEVYLGLSQGTVEGLYGHPIGTYGNKLCEVTDYCTIIDMSYVASVQLMSASCIEKLGGEGSELYNIVMEAGKELELYKDQLLNEKLETIMDEITAEGVEVYYPTEDELELWRESGQAVWGDYVGEGKMVSQEIVDKVLAIGEEL